MFKRILLFLGLKTIEIVGTAFLFYMCYRVGHFICQRTCGFESDPFICVLTGLGTVAAIIYFVYLNWVWTKEIVNKD